MDILLTEIDTVTGDGPMTVVVAEPIDEDPRNGWPTVGMFIDAPGLRPATREFMTTLAGNGYRVITPDLHHRHGRLLYFEPKDRANHPDTVSQTISGWIASMTDEQIQSDMHDALSACEVSVDTPIAAIGFCLGARAVYRAMQSDQRVQCGAGWHPSFLVDDETDSPHTTAASLNRPLYLGIGEADQVQSVAMHQRFLDAVADNPNVTVLIFPGADHGYTWPGYPTYDEKAAKTSWDATLTMFNHSIG